MKKVLSVTVTLSTGEHVLTEEDIKKLKPVLDQAFLELDESTFYKQIFGLKSEDQIKELEGMTNEDLLFLAKANDLYSIGGQVYSNFTRKIWRELFKRAGLGHKQLTRNLSSAQRSYLEAQGLKSAL